MSNTVGSFEQADLFASYSLAAHPGEAQLKPHVRVNFIASADGSATLAARAAPLGSHNDQALMRVLRAMADVVLVGAGTVRAEGYGGLTIGPAALGKRSELGFSDPPRIAIVTNSCDISPTASVFLKSEAKPLVITHAAAPEDKISQLEAVADIIFAGDAKVDVRAAITHLNEIGLHRILCEGGPHLFGALLDEGMVDEVCLTLSPNFVGGSASRIAVGAREAKRPFDLLSCLSDDAGMLYLRYRS